MTIYLEFLGKISLQVKRQLVEIFHNKDIKLNDFFKSSVRMSNAFLFKDQICCYISLRAKLAKMLTLLKPRDII